MQETSQQYAQQGLQAWQPHQHRDDDVRVRLLEEGLLVSPHHPLQGDVADQGPTAPGNVVYGERKVVDSFLGLGYEFDVIRLKPLVNVGSVFKMSC